MAEDKKTEDLLLKNYYVNNVSFGLTNSGEVVGGKLRLEDVFSKRIEKISDDEFGFTLICNLRDTDERSLPYRFSAEIKGIFRLHDWESEKNADGREIIPATILFPILRAYAITVTANTNIMPPLFLGLVKQEDWKNIKSVA